MKRRVLATVLVAVMLLCVIIPTAALAASNPCKPLAGLKISIMGDSISTYTGWSDAYPITDESCTNRYGEAYYGPEGGDFHNTDMLVTDTWWHQAATQLGAEVLMSNAGNSTGVLCASYPSIPEWDLYLKEMRGYLHRPYYLGRDGQSPDIIAVYLGSADMGKYQPSMYGSVADVDFDTLIVENADGTFTYAEPTTVAEAYCIMFHKIRTTYPNAELYLLTTLPNAGGGLDTGNKRLTQCVPFNQMLRELADHLGIHLVDTFDEFGLDPDGDGVTTQALWDEFKTYFHNDPHPNAEGFDVITKRFVETVLENSRYIVQVETTAGGYEYVGVDYNAPNAEANDYVTEGGMTVDYASTESADGNLFREEYTSDRGSYHAEGGTQISVVNNAPDVTVSLPLTDTDDAKTEADETTNRVLAREEQVVEGSQSGDTRADEGDGIYDYSQQEVVGQGAVTLHTTDVSISTTSDPEETELAYIHGTIAPTLENGFVAEGVETLTLPTGPDDVPAIADGYDYVYFGSDQFSRYYSAHAVNKPSEDFKDEEPIYTDGDLSLYVHANHSVFVQRKLIVPQMFLASGTVQGDYPARWEAIQMFRLSDRDGNVMTAYCADQTTGATLGYSYRIVNPEDATYYTPTEAANIRAIAHHAYWGTESGFGSMDALRRELVASGKFTREEADAITPGMATTATQYAFWSNANIMEGTVFLNTYICSKLVGINSTITGPADQDEAALLFKLYFYFMGLEPMTENLNTSNTIFNEKNFVEDIQLTPTARVADHANNLDADDTNDAYLMDVSFKPAIEIAENNDDSLAMYIYDSNDNLIATGRIAGTLQDGEIQLKDNGQGYYTFEDVLMIEGEENIRFQLDGTQHLARGAYLLTSENRDGETSQTMVAVAEGDRDVCVEMRISFDLDVRDERLATCHMWRTEAIVPPTGDRNYLQWILAAITMVLAAAVLYKTRRNAA